MKINEQTLQNLESNGFYINECPLGYLIIPKLADITWTKDNLIYRSSLWNFDYELISAGFPKFFNVGEQPIINPSPIPPINCVEKLDGSLLIVSRHKGELIVRTRGTADAEQLPTGFEIPILKDTYPLAFNNDWVNSECYSMLFEWLSPHHTIIIRYGDTPVIKLIGVIRHDDYSLVGQKELDQIAHSINVQRPRLFTELTTEQDVLDYISTKEGEEGIVVYHNNDQSMIKYKTTWYLHLHKLKSGINSINSLLNLFQEQKLSTYEDMIDYIKTNIDYEVSVSVTPLVRQIYETYHTIQDKISEIKKMIQEKGWTSMPRKEAAQEIQYYYGNTPWIGIAFILLDNKIPKQEQIVKLIKQLLS